MGTIPKDEIKELNETFVTKIEENSYGKSILSGVAANYISVKALEKSFADMMFPSPVDIVKEAADLILEKVYGRCRLKTLSMKQKEAIEARVEKPWCCWLIFKHHIRHIPSDERLPPVLLQLLHDIQDILPRYRARGHK